MISISPPIWEFLKTDLESWLTTFTEQPSLQAPRFISRHILPHLKQLKHHFYHHPDFDHWPKTNHPQQDRLAYFLYHMPLHLVPMAALWSELKRLGFQWPTQQFRAIDFGSGTASLPCAISLMESFFPLGLPSQGNWACIDQDPILLHLGKNWATFFLKQLQLKNSHSLHWDFKPFHRKILFEEDLLPPTAPSFHLWCMDHCLPIQQSDPKKLVSSLLKAWNQHLAEEGLIILMDSVIQQKSQKLLEFKNHLLGELKNIQVLLSDFPLIVNWWRPSYLQKLDQHMRKDHKTVCINALVLIKSKRPLKELLQPHLLSKDNNNAGKTTNAAKTQQHSPSTAINPKLTKP